MSAPVLVAGDVATLSNTFSVSGTATDPTTVSLTLTNPAGTATTYTYAATEITRSGTGAYTKDVTVTEGPWSYAWVGTGAASDVATGSFYVQSANLAGIISLAEFQAMTKNNVSGDDDTQRAMILAASDLCERHTQVWRRQTVARTFDVPCGAGKLVLRRPVLSVTSVVENGTTLAATDYTLNAEDGLLYRGGSRTPWNWMEGRQVVTVTYVAGATSIPEPVREGVKELALYLLASYRGGSGLPRAGAESFAAFRDLPNKVQMLWAPYTPVLVA